jgi:hypothetical protein
MIAMAEMRSQGYTNIEFRVADAMAWEPLDEEFDCIASVATMHHLLMEEMLVKMRKPVRVNGRLAILDLCILEDIWTNALRDVMALAVSKGLRLLKTGKLAESRSIQEAWAAHGRHDSYLTLAQFRRISESLLPGAQVRRHLLWRFSLVWQKGP